MRNVLKNLLLLCLSLLFTGLALEGFSRLVYPVQYGHKSFDLAGNPVYPASDFLGVEPGLTYRQRAQEFDVLTTHTARGTRGPAGGFMDGDNPEILFLGDSMTYGVGLSDDQTIPTVYCRQTGQTCANLGRPGIGTIEAIDILEKRLVVDGWRPLHVMLMMNVMTAAQFGGNDLSDNLAALARKNNNSASAAPSPASAAPAPATAPVLLPGISKQTILETSNLARLTYYIFAPLLRSVFSPGMDAALLERALSITQDELARLEMFSQRYAFTYTIFILHPMQDLSRGTWTQTRNRINAIAPHDKVVDTAPALLEGGNPLAHYYPLDGHLRPEGAAKVAAFMLENANAPQ